MDNNNLQSIIPPEVPVCLKLTGISGIYEKIDAGIAAQTGMTTNACHSGRSAGISSIYEKRDAGIAAQTGMTKKALAILGFC